MTRSRKCQDYRATRSAHFHRVLRFPDASWAEGDLLTFPRSFWAMRAGRRPDTHARPRAMNGKIRVETPHMSEHHPIGVDFGGGATDVEGQKRHMSVTDDLMACAFCALHRSAYRCDATRQWCVSAFGDCFRPYRVGRRSTSRSGVLTADEVPVLNTDTANLQHTGTSNGYRNAVTFYKSQRQCRLPPDIWFHSPAARKLVSFRV